MKAKRPGRACRWGGRRPAHREETKLNLEKVLRTRSLLRGEEPSGPLPTDGELLRENAAHCVAVHAGIVPRGRSWASSTPSWSAGWARRPSRPWALTTQPKFICLAVFPLAECGGLRACGAPPRPGRPGEGEPRARAVHPHHAGAHRHHQRGGLRVCRADPAPGRFRAGHARRRRGLFPHHHGRHGVQHAHHGDQRRAARRGQHAHRH